MAPAKPLPAIHSRGGNDGALWLERASRQKTSPPPASSHYLSRDDTPDLATGYALLLLQRSNAASDAAVKRKNQR
jgi:hypothetical protein